MGKARPIWYDRDGKPVDDYATINGLLRDDDYRRVGSDDVVTPGGHAVWVSTVWLGLDHCLLPSDGGSPLIFETMTFPVLAPYVEEGCWRYSTEEQARAGHARVVAALREGRDPDER